MIQLKKYIFSHIIHPYQYLQIFYILKIFSVIFRISLDRPKTSIETFTFSPSRYFGRSKKAEIINRRTKERTERASKQSPGFALIPPAFVRIIIVYVRYKAGIKCTLGWT